MATSESAREISSERFLAASQGTGADEPRPCVRRTLAEILRLALPSIASYVLQLINELTNVVFIGQSGTDSQLAAVGLGNMMQNCFGLSIGFGICSALDTFVSQAHGAKQYELSTHYLQRCRVICTLQLVWMVPLLYFSGDLLKLIHQDPAVAYDAGEYNKATIWGLFAIFQNEANRKYLQNRTHVVVPAAICGVCAVLHIAWCYIFVWHFKLGNKGAGFANVVSWNLQFVLSSTYLCCATRHLEVKAKSVMWVEKHAFTHWAEYLKMALPATLQLCGEWWFWEVCALVAGYLGKVALAAHVSTLNFVGIAFMPAIGVSTSAATLVGKALGENLPRKARLCAWLCVALNVSFWTVLAIGILFTKSYIAGFFTNEVEVSHVVQQLLTIFTVVGYFDTSQSVMGGALRGMGKPQLAATVYILAYYGMMLPLACAFAFPLQMGVYGIWYSMGIGTATATFCFSIFLTRARYGDIAAEACKRMAKEHDEECEDPCQAG